MIWRRSLQCLPSLSHIRHTATLDRLLGVGLARELPETWAAGLGKALGAAQGRPPLARIFIKFHFFVGGLVGYVSDKY